VPILVKVVVAPCSAVPKVILFAMVSMLIGWLPELMRLE